MMRHILSRFPFREPMIRELIINLLQGRVVLIKIDASFYFTIGDLFYACDQTLT